MAGNVAEWTSNAFDESAFSYTHDLNMDYHYNAENWEDRSLEEDINEVMKRKVIRGGSWKDVAYFVQNSTRTFEYQDTAKCYIGFRCAVDFLGRDKKDFEYKINGNNYVIPAGFKFDGASIPKFLHTFLSPVGVLLMGGLIHDYALSLIHI